jgi:anti-sigma regulatory factor (Ser/Thr protein kinase)
MPRSCVHTHQALFYRSDQEYLDGLSSFLAPAAAAREPAALALPGPKLELVRDSLGEVTEYELLEMSEVGRNPGRILSVIERMRNAHPGQTLHYVGEPVWPGRTPAECLEAARHEALINVALAGTPTRVLCPYDAAALGDTVLESAERTHATVVEGGIARPSATYEGVIPTECEAALSPPPSDAMRYGVEEDGLGALRAEMRGFGSRRGLSAELAGDLQLVANELAANALRHGTPPRLLTLWQASDRVVCQVENEGTISDPLAGRRDPHARAVRGVGLWIVHQLSDLVELRDGVRTTVRAHLSEA